MLSFDKLGSQTILNLIFKYKIQVGVLYLLTTLESCHMKHIFEGAKQHEIATQITDLHFNILEISRKKLLSKEKNNSSESFMKKHQTFSARLQCKYNVLRCLLEAKQSRLKNACAVLDLLYPVFFFFLLRTYFGIAVSIIQLCCLRKFRKYTLQ